MKDNINATLLFFLWSLVVGGFLVWGGQGSEWFYYLVWVVGMSAIYLFKMAYNRQAERLVKVEQALAAEQLLSESVNQERDELFSQINQQSEELNEQHIEFERMNHTRAVINHLLLDSLEPMSLEAHLDEAMLLVMAIPWLTFQAKGAIFLWDDESQELVLAVDHEMPEQLLSLCSRVPVGHCLCGQAAQTYEIIYANSVDEQHSNTYDGMPDHGHYCLPITMGEQLVGVLTLYLNTDHVRIPGDEMFLRVITTTLASIIIRSQQEEELAQLNEQLIEERNIIENVVLKIHQSPLFYQDNLRVLASSLDKTMGDIICSTISASGTHRVLLGDFTGHGLTAAIGGPLVSEIFYSDAALGIPLDETFRTINVRLLSALPEDMFMAGGCLELDSKKMQVTLFNAGLPNIFIIRNGKLIYKEPSGFVPRGLIDVPDREGVVIPVEKNDRILMCTDGMEETTNPAGKMFGEERSIQILEQIVAQDQPLELLLEDLEKFRQGEDKQDDLSLVELIC
jgi:GAF domain-containing protein